MGWSWMPAKADLLPEDAKYQEVLAEIAGAVCPLCREPIGYGVKYYGIGTEAEPFEHAGCVWTD